MDINQLLEKYWVGETTIEEEKTLKEYFIGNDIAPELLPFKSLFNYTTQSKNEQLNKRVESFIEHPITVNKKLFVRSKKFTFLKIAAAVLLLLFTSIAFWKLNQPTKAERLAKYWASKEIKDPQLAYQTSKIALLLVSKKLNGGRETALQQVAKVQRAGKSIRLD